MISATINNSYRKHLISVTTDNKSKEIQIPSKPEGFGSSVNGGEILLLALATCYTNDIYREAAKMEIDVESVDVVVKGDFDREGQPGRDISYSVKIVAPNHSPEEISRLIHHVDTVAEVPKTLRKGVEVVLKNNNV